MSSYTDERSETATLLASNRPSDESERSPPIQVFKMAPILLIGIALVAADAAVEFTSYVQIGNDFGELRHVQWLTIFYVIAVTIIQPLYSRVSDVYGRKPLLLFSYAMFGIGILMSTLSFDFWILCISRGIVGTGSGGMGYMVSLILNDIIPLRQRAIWQGGIQVGTLIGQTIGGVLGGLVVERLGWRAVFLLEFPLAPVLLISGMFVLKLPRLTTSLYKNRGADDFRGNLRNGRFDFAGSSVLLVALILLLLGLNIGGKDLSWSHPVVIALLTLCLPAFAGFVWVDLNFAKMPLVPVKKLATMELMPIMLAGFFANAFQAGLLYANPYYINVTGRGSTFRGGVMNTLLLVGVTLGQFLGGGVIYRNGRAWYVLLSGAGLLVLSTSWIIARWTGAEGMWENILPLLLNGTAIGAIMSSLLVCLLKVSEEDDRAILYGVFHIFTSTASMVSISGIAAVIQSQFRRKLCANFEGQYDGDIEKLANDCMTSLRCLDPFPHEIRKQIRKSFVQATRSSFGLLVGASIATLGVVLIVKRIRIDHIDR